MIRSAISRQTKQSFVVFLLIIVGLFSGGCERKSSPPLPDTKLLQQPVSVTRAEMPSESIPVWRTHRDSRPTLLLFSNDPLLQPILPQFRTQVTNLVTAGDPEAIRASGPLAAATVLQPSQTLTAVLDEGMFGEIVWVTPNTADSESLKGNAMPETLFRIGAIDDYERQGFTPTDYGLKGEIHGTPFQIVYYDSLPPLDTAVLLHIDLSFFTPVYLNEIKTPFFSTLKGMAQKLKEKGYPTLAASISCSNLTRWVPLERRFIASVLDTLLTTPSILDQPLPEAWQRKAESLYLSTFFQNEQRAALFKPLLAEGRDLSADDYWELYATTIKFASFEEAAGYLDQAIKRDPAYALSYTDLANKARQRALPEIEVDMWRKAAAAFPNNPYIELQLLKAQLNAGTPKKELKPDFERLQRLPWSEFYDEQVIAELDGLLKTLEP